MASYGLEEAMGRLTLEKVQTSRPPGQPLMKRPRLDTTVERTSELGAEMVEPDTKTVTIYINMHAVDLIGTDLERILQTPITHRVFFMTKPGLCGGIDYYPDSLSHTIKHLTRTYESEPLKMFGDFKVMIKEHGPIGITRLKKSVESNPHVFVSPIVPPDIRGKPSEIQHKFDTIERYRKLNPYDATESVLVFDRGYSTDSAFEKSSGIFIVGSNFNKYLVGKTTGGLTASKFIESRNILNVKVLNELTGRIGKGKYKLCETIVGKRGKPIHYDNVKISEILKLCHYLGAERVNILDNGCRVGTPFDVSVKESAEDRRGGTKRVSKRIRLFTRKRR